MEPSFCRCCVIGIEITNGAFGSVDGLPKSSVLAFKIYLSSSVFLLVLLRKYSSPPRFVTPVTATRTITINTTISINIIINRPPPPRVTVWLLLVTFTWLPDDFITGQFPSLCFEEDVVEDEDDFVWSGFCEDRLDGLGKAAIVLLSAVTITKVTVKVIGNR